MAELSTLQRYKYRKSALWTDRSSWIKRYQDITKFLLPYSGRYFAGDQNKGDRSFNSIYDETATFALDILTAGMMAGMTSPARPWFRLATPDKDLMEFDPVRWWLHEVTELMRDIFAKSNTYNALHLIYEELGAFGTAAEVIEPDFDYVIHSYVPTAGEYAVGLDDRGRVNTLVREFSMTVMQIYLAFVRKPSGAEDWSGVSPTVKNLWDTNRGLDNQVTICHIIQPREGRDTTKLDARNMRYASCYWEQGQDDDKRLLRESGYSYKPMLAPRWHVRGNDAYGNAPSFRALGSIKQLQQEQLRKGQAIDYMTKPPLQVPAEHQNSAVNILPGGISYVPTGGQNQGIRTAFDVKLDLNHLLADIQDVRGRINRAFYADLFLMISQDNRRTPATATEIAEKHEEKLLMLGPVLERLHNELLSPKIEITFQHMTEAGILPPPPKELMDMDLKVEFVSTLAQAQKMVGLGSLDRLLGTVGQIAAGSGDLSVWDKIDKDQSVDRYAEMLGVDPSIVVADDRVLEIRDQRAQAMQAQQQAAAMPAVAGAAKDLAGADTEGKNALTDVLKQFQGYS